MIEPGFWGAGLWIWLGWILIVGVIIRVVYALTRNSSQNPHDSQELTTGEKLERRYGNGEISFKEQRERNSALKDD